MASKLLIIPVEYTEQEHERVLKIEGTIEDYNTLLAQQNNKDLPHPVRFDAKQELEKKFSKKRPIDIIKKSYLNEWDMLLLEVHQTMGINYSVYRVLDFIVRQILIADNNFMYSCNMLDQPIRKRTFSTDPFSRWDSISQLIDSSAEYGYYYGLQEIAIEKWEFISEVSIDFKDKMEKIDKLIEVLRTVDPESNYAENQKKFLTEKLFDEVLEKIQVGDNPVGSFVKIDEENRTIKIKYGNFIFFKRYALAMKAVYEPLLKAVNGTRDINDMRLNKFIAKKWNLELKTRLPNLKITGEFVHDVLRATKKQDSYIEKAAISYIGNNFLDFLVEQIEYSAFEYAHRFGPKFKKIIKKSA